MATAVLPTQIYTDAVKSANDLHTGDFDPSTNQLENWTISDDQPFLMSPEFAYSSTTSGLVINGTMVAWTNSVPDGWGTYFFGTGAYLQEGLPTSTTPPFCRFYAPLSERISIEQEILTVGHKYRVEFEVIENASSGTTVQKQVKIRHNTGGPSTSNTISILGSEDSGIFGINFTAVGTWLQIGTDSSAIQDFSVTNVRVWEYLDFLGARPNLIGELKEVAASQGDGGTGVRYLKFVKPSSHQSIVVRDDNQTVRRWDASLSVWNPYRTITQRILDAQIVWAQFDPDGIYDFWAKIVGLMYSKHMSDTRVLGTFLDPTAVPSAYLSHLAYTFGAGPTSDLDISAQTPEKKQLRAVLLRLLRQHRRNGLHLGIQDALLNLGYRGYAQEIWDDPNGNVSPYERPIGYYDLSFVSAYLAWLAGNQTGTAPASWPTSGVAIHVNDLDGGYIPVLGEVDKERIARYLKRMVLPAHTYIRYFVSDQTVSDTSQVTDATSSALV